MYLYLVKFFSLTWLIYISIFSPFIPILAFFFYSFNRKEKLRWIFVFILFASVFFDSLGNLLPSKIGISYKVTFNLYVLFEGGLLHFFFYKLFERKKTIRLIIFISFGLLSISWLLHNVMRGNISVIDKISNGLESIMIIGYCLVYFYFEMRTVQYSPVTSRVDFWLVTAIFIYVSITFFIFLMPIDKIKYPNDFRVIKYISQFGNIIYSALVTVAFTIKSTVNINKGEGNKSSIYNITDY